MLARSIEGTPRARDIDAAGDDGRYLRRSVSTHYQPSTQIATHAYRYNVANPDGSHRRYNSDFTMHVFFPLQLDLLYRLTGFYLERMLGSY